MAILTFNVEAKYEELKGLIAQVHKLENQLRQTNASINNFNIEGLEAKLAKAKGRVAELVKEASEAGSAMDLGKLTGAFESFDNTLLKFCDNIDKYFSSLQSKVNELKEVMAVSEASLQGLQGKGVEQSQLDNLKSQNQELVAQIKSQSDAIEEEKRKFKELADAIKTNNVDAIQRLKQETDEASKRLKMDEARGSLKDVSREMETLSSEMSKVSGDVDSFKAKWESLQASGAEQNLINEAKANYEVSLEKLNSMKSEYNELATYQKRYTDQIREASGHSVRMRTQIMNAREELVKMVQNGKFGTKEFYDMAKSAGDMRKSMILSSAYMQYFATPNSHLNALKQGLQGVAGGFGLVTSVMGLFNTKSKEMVEIQTKIQSVLGIIVGLETTFNTVKKSSNVMIALGELRMWALAKATDYFAISTANATKAQIALNVAMKGFPLLMLASILGGAIMAVRKFTKESNDAKEAHKKLIKELESQKEVNMKIGTSVGDLVGKYSALRVQFSQLKSEHEKKKWIEENKSAFNSLGLTVRNTTQAYATFVKNAPQVIEALKQIAKANAYKGLYEDSIVKKETREKTQKTGEYYKKFNPNAIFSWDFVGKYGIGGKYKEFYKNINGKDYFKWTEEGKKLVERSNMKNLEDAQKLRDKNLKKFTDKEKEFEKKYENAIKEAEEAKKKLQGTGVEFGDNKKVKEAKDRTAEVIEDNSLKTAQRLTKLQIELQQAIVDGEEDGLAKQLHQIDVTYDKTISEIKAREEDFVRQRYEMRKKEFEANSKNKNKHFMSYKDFISKEDEGKLTEEEKELVQKLTENAVKQKEQQTKDALKADEDYMLKYLEEYGTYEEKRFALSAQTENKIEELRKRGASEDEINIERKKYENAIKSLDFDEFKESIDWECVFGNLQSYSTEYLESVRAQISEFVKEGNILPEQAKALVEQLNKIDDITSKRKDVFAQIFSAYSNYLSAVNREKTAEEELNALYEKRNQLLKEGKDTKEVDAQITKKITQISKLEQLTNISELKKLFGEMNEIQIAKTVNSNVQSANDLVKTIGLGNTDFGQKFDKFAEGIGDFTGIIDKLASGDVLGAVNNVVKGFQSFGHVFGIGGGNASRVNRITQENTEAIKYLTERIKALSEDMKKATTYQSLNIFESQKKAQEEINKKAMETLVAQMEYHSAHHSNAYYADNAEIERLYREEVGNAVRAGKNMVESIKGLNDIYTMTPEQLSAIKTYMPSLWKYLTEVGKYDKSEYWEDVVAQAGKVEELTESINQKLTSTNLDSLKNEFASLLKTMETQSKDWSDKFEDNLRNAIANSLTDDYTDDIEEWYGKFAEAMKGGLTEGEKEALKRDYEQLAQEMQDRRDAYFEIADIKDSSGRAQGTVNASKSITDDTANDIVGRITAMQIAVENQKNKSNELLMSVQDLSKPLTTMEVELSIHRNIADETRTILANSYLELQSIRENTNAVIAPIKQMATTLEQVKLNTERL